MADVELREVAKSFGRVKAIKSVSLAIADGEFCVLVGPSGCGKSTLLRLIAGLEDVTSGTIRIDGREVTRWPPAERGIAMVFQSYALYPHMSVVDNITFGLKTMQMGKAETRRRLERAVEMLQLEGLLDRKPAQLSGGQRQRVAIGRAIVREPQVFLFDEPLSNLDAALRTQMRVELSALHQELGTTIIYVTHDQVEAMTLADRIVVLNHGEIEQHGAPLDVYRQPASLFVAGFIGSPGMNMIATHVVKTRNGEVQVELPSGCNLIVPAKDAHLGSGSEVILGIRPEHLRLANAADAHIVGSVVLAERLGAETIIHAAISADKPLIVRCPGVSCAKVGDTVHIAVDTTACHLFSPGGSALTGQ